MICSSRSERVADRLREEILKGKWRDPLPSTREWARKLGVSPPTLRTALAVLQKEGVLLIQKRQGIRLGQAAHKRQALPAPQMIRLIVYRQDYDRAVISAHPW